MPPATTFARTCVPPPHAVKRSIVLPAFCRAERLPRRQAPIFGDVVQLMGIAISTFEAGRLVASLSEQGSDHALAAAARIRRELEAEEGSVVLTDAQADLILALLEATPNRLPELRETLLREREQKIAS
jgi:uncharacterized protein (DUF1778 family)